VGGRASLGSRPAAVVFKENGEFLLRKSLRRTGWGPQRWKVEGGRWKVEGGGCRVPGVQDGCNIVWSLIESPSTGLFKIVIREME
jgi:anti-sigma factor ChrR (cupin superfamily)